jgi:hypothetical protein
MVIEVEHAGLWLPAQWYLRRRWRKDAASGQGPFIVQASIIGCRIVIGGRIVRPIQDGRGSACVRELPVLGCHTKQKPGAFMAMRNEPTKNHRADAVVCWPCSDRQMALLQVIDAW